MPTRRSHSYLLSALANICVLALAVFAAGEFLFYDEHFSIKTSRFNGIFLCTRICKPDSVHPTEARIDDHLSGIRIATNLKRPYGLALDRCLPRLSSPTVPRELLPHDFTLASRVSTCIKI